MGTSGAATPQLPSELKSSRPQFTSLEEEVSTAFRPDTKVAQRCWQVVEPVAHSLVESMARVKEPVLSRTRRRSAGCGTRPAVLRPQLPPSTSLGVVPGLVVVLVLVLLAPGVGT
jgi:hypothetical protein